MQRSSNTTARNIIIGSVIVILLVSVLYYLKRVEVYHLKKNIDSLQVQRSDHDEELNSKLTDYLQKLEDMTHQLGDLNSRLQECEDSKANLMTEVQKCKEVFNECTAAKDKLDKDMGGLRKELKAAKGQHDQARSQLSSHQEAAQNAKQALASSEKELEQCDLDKDACRDAKTRTETQLQECQQILSQCQSAKKGGGAGGFKAFQQSRPEGPGQQGPLDSIGGAGNQGPRGGNGPPAGPSAGDAPNHHEPPVKTTEKEVPQVDKEIGDAIADPLNANGDDDDRPGGGIDDALAALDQADGGGGKDGPAPLEGAQKDSDMEPKAKEEKAEEDQELEAVRELEKKAKQDVVL